MVNPDGGGIMGAVDSGGFMGADASTLDAPEDTGNGDAQVMGLVDGSPDGDVDGGADQ